MRGPSLRCLVQALRPFMGLVWCSALAFGGLLTLTFVQGQSFVLDKNTARSFSGQFIVFGTTQFSPLAGSLKVANDTNLVRLQPALLAVSAERIKDALERHLEIKPGTPWRGQIYLAIHPARSLDENVTIISKHVANGWDYRVELPDVLSHTRFTRALAGVLLLELANRGAQSHSAEVPAWLVDGFAEDLLGASSPEFILSTPDKIVNGIPVQRVNAIQHGWDSLTAAQHILQRYPALTFEQLSWPTGAQQAGQDGGAYNASAQFFVSSLLDLKNGPERLRVMLETLPQFYNWQFAFQSAFRADFPRPLDVEKWWSLQVAALTERDAGPLWTPAASLSRLDDLLSIPVEARMASNSLPAHAEISLQTVIRSMESDRQTSILQTTLQNLGLAQFRMAPQFAALTEEYRRALAGYLGEHPSTLSTRRRQPLSTIKVSANKTLKKLDELDVRRRNLESTIKPDNFIQPTRIH